MSSDSSTPKPQHDSEPVRNRAGIEIVDVEPKHGEKASRAGGAPVGGVTTGQGVTAGPNEAGIEPGEDIEALAAHDAEHTPATSGAVPAAGRPAAAGASPATSSSEAGPARPSKSSPPPLAKAAGSESSPARTPKPSPPTTAPPTPAAAPASTSSTPAVPEGTGAAARPASTTPVAPAPSVPSAPAATSAPARKPVDRHVLERVASGSFHDPHSVLGAHIHQGALTVRSLRPFAASVAVVLPDGERVPMEHEFDGVWVTVLPTPQVPDYRLAVTYQGVGETVVDEPYRYLPTLGEVDLHLIREGRHEQLWEVLGAHVRRYPGSRAFDAIGEITGTSFAVWAPNAQAVRVVGDFNHWVGRGHAMRSLGDSGVWELFIPGVGPGARYKYEILGRDGHWRQKADPLAFATEVPPSTASLVTESSYEWQDDEWMRRRAATDPHTGPMSVYEVHLGSWRQGLSYRELADQLVGYVKDMGFTHVEFLPVAEHPFGGSWGYQVTSYYAASSRFGSADDFRFLVDRLHRQGIGVILDWVPAHFPKDEWALARFDGQTLYEYGDPRRGEHPDWGTLVFDFGRHEVRNFLVANALYWLEEFHIDGLRVDAVASMLYLDYSRNDGEWLPNAYGGREHLEAISFLQEMNATAYRRVPGVVTIAEESTAWPGVTRATHLGGLGFGLKWNMGWMHDSLQYMSKEPIYRQYHHGEMTFSLVYAFSENYVLPISHDEVVHGKGSLLRKMPGDRWQQLANLRAFLAYMWSHPGKQLIFMGAEFGQEAEWAEMRSLDWWLEQTPGHSGLQQLVRDLNRLYAGHPQLWALDSDAAGFEWIDANDSPHNTFSYLRKDRDGGLLAVVVNFAAIPHDNYRIGLPHGGRWREVLNTDAELYGGSGVGNLGAVVAQDVPWHGRPASAELRVPPLAAVWLVPDED
jgi:1,4-alpha-glucan branching enzyme